MKRRITQIIADSQSVPFEPVFKVMPQMNRLHLLEKTDEAEVLEFLSIRPVHTVVMKSFILDNGLVAEDNRGKFFGYRAPGGKLEGVALIGHTTLIEARSNEAVTAFALQARVSETPIHIIMSDSRTTAKFWNFYAEANQKPRLSCMEMLFELHLPFLVQECAWNVRLAEAGELEQIAAAHAEIAFIESGVNPMEKDREGFLRRTLKRIEKGRTFVVFENNTLVFKADIVAETEDVIYLEGIYVAEEYRGRSVASQCLSKMSLQLLTRAENICLLSNEDFKAAHKAFGKAGFKNTDKCLTLFV
jgi:GNAT superfamily N-acetyltransferase